MARKNHNEEAMVEYFLDNYDGENEFGTGDETLEQKCLLALNEYKRVCEYPANERKLVRLADRVADHMRGLPAPFHPEIYNYDIEAQLKEWGVLAKDAPHHKVAQMVENYYLYWALWIIEKAEGA